jgi:hypothetical protein
MNPIKFGQLMKHLVRAKQKKPDLPEVFRASDAPIPEETLTRDMFKEAQERFKNAKAGGGMLVQPGFGGTRQGYRSEKTQAVKRGGDKELLLRLVKKANEGFKYVKRKDLQVQAGYKRSTNITAKQIGLDTLETKFKKAFDFVMGNPDKFVTDMFDPMTQVKKLVGTNEAVGRYLKDYAPYEESRRLIKVLAAPRSKSFLQKAEGLTLGDLEFRIDNNIKGDNLFAPPKQVTAETKIMEIVYRHIKQGGKKIKWTVKPEITKGGYPSFGESRFIYNGKEYGMGELINEARDDPNFKEFFKAQRDYKTLNDKIVTNPKTGEKIRFGNLMKEVYGDSVVPYNIDHVKSIVDEPFTSLRILPARINKAAGNITQMDEKFITNPELKGKYTKQGKEAQLKKIGYNFNQPVEDLIQAELKLADDVLNKGRNLRKPNEIVESIRKGENYVPDFYSKTAKPGPGFERQLSEGQQISANLRKLGFKCKFAGSSGGVGSCDDPMSYVDDIKKQEDLFKVQNRKAPQAVKTLNTARKLNAARSLFTSTLGPGALAFEAVAALPIAYMGYRGGKTPANILADSTFNLIGKSDQRVLLDKAIELGYDTSNIKNVQNIYKKSDEFQKQSARADEFMGPEDLMMYPRMVQKAEEDLLGATQKFLDPLGNVIPEREAGFDQLAKAEQAVLKDQAKLAAERQSKVGGFLQSPVTDYLPGLAGGGIAKLAGVDSGPPPASGPNSQGLQGLMKRVKRM